MLERPKCLFCMDNIPYIDLVTEFRYTWIYGGKKYNKPRERVWTCKKCRMRLRKSLDEVEPLVRAIFHE